MKKTILTYFACFFAVLVSQISSAKIHRTDEPKSIVIPLGGNAWVNEPAQITDEGLTNWADQKSVASIYFRVSVVQDIQVSLRLKVASGESTISVSNGKNTINKKINNTTFDTVAIGKIHLTKAGYVKIDLKGISKTGAVYADVADLIIKTDKPDNDLVYVKAGSSFHFGRRGPSVHLNFNVPAEAKSKVRWFYNEITVPTGMDVLGSYFMADGFGQGYFGMQVNSPTTRHVLFSVWSPFDTQDPKSIPDSMRIKMLKKGENVHAGEFGNEGSGGQSYMNYPWKAGSTYAFLLGAESDSATNTTIFTAYFKDVAAGKWYLVASFKRPQKATYLTSLYSFVENFEPDNGDKIRRAYFDNQWISTTNGDWLELTQILYTADATAKANYRKDYAGGLKDGKFYLENGGFFDAFVPYNTPFSRQPGGHKPVINLNELPVK
ncbi:protein of unknown function [Mucilaginibacter pineti]|uniref:DUF5077 domain-containing protein n=1 Tax=Mucilaginibacter pineti TaxID=1391627 RepID=A0A1G6STY8_9SPHI|nr:DUF3472 domain-containing protein [Mucilaginibacter pineti]SDD20390.1 protein of unknown function [Mucilaginibacter pineti]